jgi:hypothetical protein
MRTAVVSVCFFKFRYLLSLDVWRDGGSTTADATLRPVLTHVLI